MSNKRSPSIFRPSKSKFKHEESLSPGLVALLTILDIAGKTEDRIVPTKISGMVRGLLEIFKTTEQMTDNANDLSELNDHLLDISDIITSVIKDGPIDTSASHREQVQQLIDELHEIVGLYGRVRSSNRLTNLLVHEGNLVDVTALNNAIDTAIHAFQVGGSTLTHQAIMSDQGRINWIRNRLRPVVDHLDPLGHLMPYIADAAFDSTQRKNISRCFRGTRNRLLRDIYDWAREPARKPIYLLYGLAGTGKTTIAQTVAENFSEEGVLGASFFFSRDVADHANPGLVFTSIAYQLSLFHPSFYSHISASLQNHPDAPSADLKTQVEGLIKPLKVITDAPRLVVLVIDALDECSDEVRAEEILILLESVVRELPFQIKVFMTTTGSHIRTQFEKSSMRRVRNSSFLRDIGDERVQPDIGLYLRHHFTEISRQLLDGKKWFEEGQLHSVIARCRGLFVYASAVTAFIGDVRYRQPKQRLERILAKEFVMWESHFTEMDRLYRCVLEHSVPPVGSRGFSRRLQKVLAATVLLSDPLPVSALEKLLSLERRSAWQILMPLQSVLSVSQDPSRPTQALHTSFPDFLIDPERCTDSRLLVVPAVQHRELALACLDSLNKDLQRNMCNIQEWWIKNSDIPNLLELLENMIGPHLLYACSHWDKHLKHTTPDDTKLYEAFRQFCSTKLLYWLEILSLLGRLSAAIPALRVAQKWHRDHHPNLDIPVVRGSFHKRLLGKVPLVAKHYNASINQASKLTRNAREDNSKLLHSGILQDCMQFINQFFEPISWGFAHIYHSALPFTPQTLLYQNNSAEL